MQPTLDFPDQTLDPQLDPTWSEGSAVYHLFARCRTLQLIAPANRRSQKRTPASLSLCDFCENIQRRGYAG